MIPAIADRLTGVYPVLPTPLLEDQSLDLDGLAALVDRVLSHGVRGLTVLGSGGEGVYLTEEERRRVLSTVVKRTSGRAVVVAGLLHFGTSVAVDQGRQFRDLGADALLVALPQPYQMPLVQVVAHFGAVAHEVGLPTLYFHQGSPHAGLEPEQLGRLFADVSLVGIDSAAGDRALLSEQIRAVGRPISMFAARSADTLACLASGGVGTMCPIAGLMPGTAQRLVDEYRAGNDAGALAAESALRDAHHLLTGDLAPEELGVAHWGVKEALAAAGVLRSSAVRHPQPGLSGERRAQIRQHARAIVEL